MGTGHHWPVSSTVKRLVTNGHKDTGGLWCLHHVRLEDGAGWGHVGCQGSSGSGTAQVSVPEAEVGQEGGHRGQPADVPIYNAGENDEFLGDTINCMFLV